MESFRWDKCFITGIQEVDEQHHRLIDVINQFGELVTQKSSISPEEVEPIFRELADYAVYHFQEEESLMERQGVDLRHIEPHKQAHASFLAEVTQMHEGLSTAHPEAANFLLKFLTHWLAYHILGQDQILARQITAIGAGQSPESAYLASDESRDPATDTLLHALNGLFHQVSERNHELQLLNQTLEARVAERTQALSEANQRLEDMAMTDILTGLPNRRHALRRFEREWEDSTRNATPLACMMIDADGFKQINDTCGHDAGDVVLRELSRLLAHSVRTDDMVCRLGGDEFLVICSRTPLAGALTFGEELRSRVAALRVPAGQGEWRGSISVGVAARTADMPTLDALMKAADEGVYIAKRSGRNCVATAQES